jgi:hypothetical protein
VSVFEPHELPPGSIVNIAPPETLTRRDQLVLAFYRALLQFRPNEMTTDVLPDAIQAADRIMGKGEA